MRNFFVLFGALTILTTTPGLAAMKSTAQVDAQLSKFMDLIREKKSKEAGALLLDQWRKPGETPGLITAIENEGKFNENEFGKIEGVEKVGTCRVGKFLYRAQWVLKHQKNFVHWNFTFYNPGNEWILNGYSFANTSFAPLKSDCR